MPRWLALFIALSATAHADPALTYRLRYDGPPSAAVSVEILLPRATKSPVVLVMPRTYPGGYAQLPYDAFVSEVTAQRTDGNPASVSKDGDAPRWAVGSRGEQIERIRYQVNVALMETGIHDAVSSSKLRDGYAGLLGYSIFAYLDGMEEEPVHLHVQGPPGWPVLSTLKREAAAGVPTKATSLDADAANFYDFADSQVLMGPALQVSTLPGAIDLRMALYAEGPVDAGLEGRMAREALDDVQRYFGDRPMTQYTVQLELLRTLAGHGYGFSQEHVASGTFSLSADAALTAESPREFLERARFNFAHHMAHSWIPKRAYGEGYRPFNWEMTPVIDTIWFNEGFGRYAAIAALADAMQEGQAGDFRQRQLSMLRDILNTAPAFIRRMPLAVLSREASFLYGEDFRTGRNVFARGALMAAEMDERIRAQSHGEKSLRDALRGLLRWSEEHHKAFRGDDLAEYLASATGVNVADILERWLKPLDSP